MKIEYTKLISITIVMVLGLVSTACAGNIAQQMQQNQPAAGGTDQQQYVPQEQQQYYQDNDSQYRLPGQYSPTLNDLRKQFPQQPPAAKSYQYNKQQYDQNDNGTGTNNNYYYQ